VPNAHKKKDAKSFISGKVKTLLKVFFNKGIDSYKIKDDETFHSSLKPRYMKRVIKKNTRGDTYLEVSFLSTSIITFSG